MRSVIVTGATKGIGFEIAKMLISNGYFVYALGRDFSKCNLDEKKCEKINIDLSEFKEIKNLKSKIQDKNLKVLVNCAGFGRFMPHEELSLESINEMIFVNLNAPILLSNIFLRTLKSNQGFIFNINSISGINSAPFGAVYGASKAGLRHFGTSLFDEARKSGIKVVNISPDITKTDFFEKLNFSYDEDEATHILPEDISKMIEFCINSNQNINISDITIQPQKFRIKKTPKAD